MQGDIQEIVDAAAERAAEKAARRTFEQVMLALGVNPNDPKSVKALRSHMDHLANNYEACQMIRPYVRHTIMTAIGAVALSIVGYFLVRFGLPKP